MLGVGWCDHCKGPKEGEWRHKGREFECWVCHTITQANARR